MNDRELLELAAKAAGFDFNKLYFDVEDGLLVWRSSEGQYESNLWNPLVNDGDALRLAVALDFDVAVYRADDNNNAPATIACGYESTAYHNEPHGADKYAATRRCITMAAAEIGMAMP